MSATSPFKVVYLTGAPASGKSSLGEAVVSACSEVFLFSYSKELAQMISKIHGTTYTQENLREQSSHLITPEVIEVVDRHLISFVEGNRSIRHVIIDSHAVTKEHYGFRVTPFSSSLLGQLAPDLLVSLYTKAETTINRISADPKGRPIPTSFEADAHTFFQASVAVSYSIQLGKPLYFLDSDSSLENLVDWFKRRLPNQRKCDPKHTQPIK